MKAGAARKGAALKEKTMTFYIIRDQYDSMGCVVCCEHAIGPAPVKAGAARKGAALKEKTMTFYIIRDQYDSMGCVVCCEHAKGMPDVDGERVTAHQADDDCDCEFCPEAV